MLFYYLIGLVVLLALWCFLGFELGCVGLVVCFVWLGKLLVFCGLIGLCSCGLVICGLRCFVVV